MTPALRVMIVDDAVELARAMADAIQRAPGVDVIAVVHDGTEAVESGIALVPDIVVMDMRMPKMDGLEATRVLLAAFPEMAIVVHSAYQDESLIEEARRSGARGFVIKGSPPSVLQSAIAEAHESGPGAWFVQSA